jgi:uncharacterized membrane protein
MPRSHAPSQTSGASTSRWLVAREVRLGAVIAWWLLWMGAWVIARGSAVYFVDGHLAPFVVDKGVVGLDPIWVVALRVHVIAAPCALLAAALQLLRRVRVAAPRLHRLLGRVVAVVVMVAVVPSAIVLSFVAKGGWPSTVGFVVSAGLTAVAMVRSVRCARARRFAAHRRWAWHVVAQLSVALSSRAILRLTFDTALDPTVAYWVSLWGPMILGVVAVEILTRTPQGSSSVEPSR